MHHRPNEVMAGLSTGIEIFWFRQDCWVPITHHHPHAWGKLDPRLSPVKQQHYNDVIMSTIASQVTSLTIVYSTVYSGADQSKHQSSAPLAFVRGIHRGPVNSPHKGPVTRNMFPFDDVIMKRLYSDVTWWLWRLKSPATPLLLNQANTKGNIKGPYHWTLWGESNVDRWNLLTCNAGRGSIWLRHRELLNKGCLKSMNSSKSCFDCPRYCFQLPFNN